MARTHGRIMAAIWSDADFIAMRRSAQGMFMFLLSQPDLSHAGLLPMRVRRWATKADDLTAKNIRDELDYLAERGFIVVDEDTEEVLVRTFVRNDGVYKQPKVMLRLREDAKQIESPTLRAAFRAELDRLPLDELNDKPGGPNGDLLSTRGQVFAVVEALREDFREGIGYPSERVSGRVSEDRDPTDAADAVENTVENDEPAGQSVAERVSGRVSDTQSDTPRVGAGAFHLPPTTSHQPPSTGHLPPTAGRALAIAPADATTRGDVERICNHLADRIAEDGSQRPSIGKGWRDAARLMLDKDGRTEDEIHAAIDWCQSHHFWRANVLSLPKLREKYDQLRKVAAAEKQRPARQQQTDDLFTRAAIRMGVQP